ncbi:MAG: hypothetical protein HY866_15860, partial [Chloroflexi bacterium]|nr:hypothetical protein [Chloroflexota bacterium]
PNLCQNNRLMLAVGLIVLGGLFLMDMGMLWPLFVLVPGLFLLGVAIYGGKAGIAGFSIPGMLVTGTGALLFIQNLTGYWESWSYAWTLYGAFLGMGFMMMGQRLPDDGLHRVGQKFVQVSLMTFAAFAFFFEIIIGISGGLGPLGPAALILIGLYLLSRDSTGMRLLASMGNQPESVKQKNKNKPKRGDEPLFTGPVVYGTPARDASRLSTTEAEEVPSGSASRYDR